MTLSEKLAARGLDWIVPGWPAPPNVRALMTTRNGGISTGLCATMNVAGNNADDPSRVEHNKQLLRSIIDVEPRWLSQVHGTDVAVIDAPASAGPVVADAAIATTRGVAAAVRVADCLPVLFCDRGGTRVAAAHAGWRGLAAGVLERTVEAMQVAPSEIVVWMGPAIGSQAFEVGDDVRDAFIARDPASSAAFAPYPRRSGKWLADLFALATQRLRSAGVESIHGGGECTVSNPARYFSYRRDKSPGRMAALVWLD